MQMIICFNRLPASQHPHHFPIHHHLRPPRLQNSLPYLVRSHSPGSASTYPHSSPSNPHPPIPISHTTSNKSLHILSHSSNFPLSNPGDRGSMHMYTDTIARRVPHPLVADFVARRMRCYMIQPLITALRD